MLTQNAKLSLQNRKWAPNLEFGDTKIKLGTRIPWLETTTADCPHKIGNEEQETPGIHKILGLGTISINPHPISQLRIRKANAVEKHANGRKIVAAGPRK